VLLVFNLRSDIFKAGETLHHVLGKAGLLLIELIVSLLQDVHLVLDATLLLGELLLLLDERLDKSTSSGVALADSTAFSVLLLLLDLGILFLLDEFSFVLESVKFLF